MKIKNIIHLSLYVSLFAMTIFIFGCSDSASPENEQGQIKLTLVDGPGDFDEVNIVISRVEVHKAGSDSTSGWSIINSVEETYDLLLLRNGASAVLGNSKLDAGHYSQIRLIIGTGSNIIINGEFYSLDVMSGEESGVKLNHAFDIEAGLVYELMLDFDAGHSIIQTGNGQYKLKPVIRLVPAVISGTISGRINPAAIQAAIYTITGLDTVSTFADPTSGSFQIMALLQGTYSVKVYPTNTLYRDTTITSISVVAKQNTDLGTITLELN